MPTTYTTRQGEMVDLICYRHYGRTNGPVEDVLRANPGLAAMGPKLPFATVVLLPDPPRSTSPSLVSLWD